MFNQYGVFRAFEFRKENLNKTYKVIIKTSLVRATA